MKARRAAVAASGLAIAAIAIWLIGHRDHERTADAPGSAQAGSPATTPATASGGSGASPHPAAIGPIAAAGSAAEAGTAGLPDGGPDVYQTGGVVTLRVREIGASLKKLVRQCYDNVHAQRPNVRGRLKMSVHLVHDDQTGNLIAKAEVDHKDTTLADRELLECATENVFAAEEVLDKLRADKDATGGNIVFKLDFTFPPLPEVKDPWPADDASPECTAPATVKGDKPPRGDRQWCELPDGTKDGDEYQWSDGKLQMIVIYEHGSSHQVRMRPLDQ